MAISVSAVFSSDQTDHQANPITLVLASPIPVGAKALLCNASTIDDAAGFSPGAVGWGGIDTITDSRGNTWVRDVWTPVDSVDTFTTVEIWRSDITTALQNSDVVTVTGDTRGLSMEMGILDCRGLAPGGPTQKSAASNLSSATAYTSASITTTTADSLLVAVAGAGAGAEASGWWTPGAGWTEQVDRGFAGTIHRSVAIQTQIVSVTGTYTATGTASPASTGNMQLAAYAAAATGQTTGIVQLALGPILKPDTSTGHEVHVRARKANPSEAGVLRVWLYEAGALRSGPWDVGLNDNFTASTILLPDADAATIGGYGNLEFRLQGIATSGAITPQVSFIELQTPGASIADPGQTAFPNFELPGRGTHPLFLHPGAMMRRPGALYDDYSVASGATNYVDSGSGTISFTGPASESLTHTISPSGTITFTGTAAQTFTHTGSQSGSLTFTGSLAEAQTHAASQSGSVTFSGSSTIAHAYTDHPSGSVTFTGSSAETTAHTSSQSGSFTFSGSSSESNSSVPADDSVFGSAMLMLRLRRKK